jgi:tRNA pseudouridine13 synthase
MILKKIPEDFYVEEIFDFEKVNIRDEERGEKYFYFYLTKKNYSLFFALDKISKIFHVSRKRIHFAGTKDKIAITKQVISIYNLDENNFLKNLDYFNSKLNDLKLEYIGKFKSRINLGDNIGNFFKIVIRDLDEDSINILKNNILLVEKEGVLNYFDSQRFGYANNSHIIGKYIIMGNFKDALKEILLSRPENESSELKIYLDFLQKNIEEIFNSNEELINEAISLMPKHRKDEVTIFKHLLKYKNDYLGAFRTLNKKIRTLYVNAYQSYVFNEILNNFDLKDLPNEIELIHKNFKINNNEINNFVLDLIKKDNISLENFEFKSLPEFKFNVIKRKTKIFPKDIKILNIDLDDLNESNERYKVQISFKLDSGEYATNVVSYLFK